MSVSKGLSAALENLQQTQKMKLLNHQKTTAAADDNSVSVVVSLPASRRGSRQASRAGSPDRNSTDSGIRYAVLLPSFKTTVSDELNKPIPLKTRQVPQTVKHNSIKCVEHAYTAERSAPGAGGTAWTCTAASTR